MIIGYFQPKSTVAQVFVLDSIRTNNMTNLTNLLNSEREKRFLSFFPPYKCLPPKTHSIIKRLNCGIGEEFLPAANQKFEIKIETNETKVDINNMLNF